MAQGPLLFCFDYLDPLSFLIQGELDVLAAEGILPPVRRLPLELSAPPQALLDPEGEAWTDRWRPAVEAARRLGLTLSAPRLIPWTRKAHELFLHAREHGRGEEAHRALFRAVFEDGRDVGRVDVLVDVARTLGLDVHETKVVLDVDRHAGAVEDLREEAGAVGATAPPTLVLDDRRLEGFHNRDALRTFLLR